MKSILFISIGFFLFLTVLVGSTQWGRGRFMQTSIFYNETDEVLIRNDLLMLSNDEGHTAALTARIFHNKIVAYGQRLIEQYKAYFSPEFLQGSKIVPMRYRVSHVGLLYIAFLLAIIFFFFSQKTSLEKSFYRYCLYLLIISPISSALVVDDFPNINRSLFMIFPLTILIAVGINNLLNIIVNESRIKKYGIIIIFGGFFMLECTYYTHQYFFHAGSLEGFWRNADSKSRVLYIKDAKNKYPRIIAPTTPWTPIYYLFFSTDFDKKYIGQFMNDFKISRIDNIEFTDMECPSSMAPFPQDNKERIKQFNNTLFLDIETCKIPKQLTVVDTIKGINGSDAFRILVYKQ